MTHHGIKVKQKRQPDPEPVRKNIGKTDGQLFAEFCLQPIYCHRTLKSLTDASPKRASNDRTILDILIIAVSFAGFNNPKTASIQARFETRKAVLCLINGRELTGQSNKTDNSSGNSSAVAQEKAKIYESI